MVDCSLIGKGVRFRIWGCGMRISALLPALILTLVSTVALAGAAFQPPQTAGASVAVLYGPGTTLESAVAMIAAQGGRVERTGKWENLIVASFGNRPAPVDSLTQGGAWIVFDPLLAGGCNLLNAGAYRPSA